MECPYCEKINDVCHDDGFDYSPDAIHKMECSHCGKSFVFRTYITFHYEPEKADCLNGGNHDYKLTCSHPRECSRMRCSMCDSERDLTDDERIKFNISTIESYIDSLK